jgi:hypothetical protein
MVLVMLCTFNYALGDVIRALKFQLTEVLKQEILTDTLSLEGRGCLGMRLPQGVAAARMESVWVHQLNQIALMKC